MRRRGAFAAVALAVGYILSPLSLWNDAFVNIPLSIAIAGLVELAAPGTFLIALPVAYAVTNIVGIALMAYGAARLGLSFRELVRGKQAPRWRGGRRPH